LIVGVSSLLSVADVDVRKESCHISILRDLKNAEWRLFGSLGIADCLFDGGNYVVVWDGKAFSARKSARKGVSPGDS
jgi:hypothetical protein